MNSGSGSGCRVLMTKNFYRQKKHIFFSSKIAIYLSLGLHEEGQPLKESIQHFKKCCFLVL
jgi:hypothetical protein